MLVLGRRPLDVNRLLLPLFDEMVRGLNRLKLGLFVVVCFGVDPEPVAPLLILCLVVLGLNLDLARVLDEEETSENDPCCLVFLRDWSLVDCCLLEALDELL